MNRFTFYIPTHDNDGNARPEWLTLAKEKIARFHGGYTMGEKSTGGYVFNRNDGTQFLLEETMQQIHVFADDASMIHATARLFAQLFEQEAIMVAKSTAITATFITGVNQ